MALNIKISVFNGDNHQEPKPGESNATSPRPGEISTNQPVDGQKENQSFFYRPEFVYSEHSFICLTPE